MATIIRGKNRRKPYTVRYWVAGRQRERSFATSREANDFRAKVEYESRAQIFIEPDVRTTLGQYAETWLAQHTVSEGTRRTYRSVFDNQIRPVFGDRPIGRIRREDVRTLLLDTMPRTVGPAAVRTARTVLVAMLGEAERSGRIAANPAARIRLPATESQRASFTMATRDQLEALTSGLPQEWALAVWLMRGCGLRNIRGPRRPRRLRPRPDTAHRGAGPVERHPRTAEGTQAGPVPRCPPPGLRRGEDQRPRQDLRHPGARVPVPRIRQRTDENRLVPRRLPPLRQGSRTPPRLHAP